VYVLQVIIATKWVTYPWKWVQWLTHVLLIFTFLVMVLCFRLKKTTVIIVLHTL